MRELFYDIDLSKLTKKTNFFVCSQRLRYDICKEKWSRSERFPVYNALDVENPVKIGIPD